MYKSLAVIISVVAVVFITSRCKHDPDEIPTPSKENSNSPINIKDSICFSAEIQPVFNTYCAYSGCHDALTARDGINLSDFQSVKAVDGNSIVASIKKTTNGKMPPKNSLQLPLDKITLIEQWVKEGMQNNVDCSASCDLTNVTFSGTVFPIIRDYCNGCHNNTSPALSSYEAIKAQVDNGKLICSIDHGNGCSAMPPTGTKLTDCKINQIKKWISLGNKND